MEKDLASFVLVRGILEYSFTMAFQIKILRKVDVVVCLNMSYHQWV